MPASTIPFTSAGTLIAVSPSLPATYDQAGFVALLDFDDIGEITDAGEYGREYALVTFNALGDRRTKKYKGSYNDGAMALQMARVPGDAGHIVMLAALDSDASYSFRVTLQDGTINYFTAKVLSYKTNVGSVDQITAANSAVEIDNDIVEVAPA